jgi:DNA-binding MarR family transcriptional regulator
MGWLQDLLREVPLSSVLKERVALAEEKYDLATKEIEFLKQRIGVLEDENAKLRAQIILRIGGATLSDDTTRVLMHIFRTNKLEDRDVGAMAVALAMERSVFQYHLDQLKEAGLAESAGGNHKYRHTYWALTSNGRGYVVEHKLV